MRALTSPLHAPVGHIALTCQGLHGNGSAPCSSLVTRVARYVFAYLVPFIVAGMILQPMPYETLAISGLFIGHINNLIHTPWAEALSEKYVPWLGVSTADHFEHHRKLTNNYAAPTLNVDRLVGLVPTLEQSLASMFGRALGKPVGQAEAKSKPQ